MCLDAAALVRYPGTALDDACAHSGVYLYTVELPKVLNTNGTANLVVETIQTHATYAWPQEAAQKDDQSMKYDTELFVLSPYKTAVQRTKFR